MVVGSIYAVMVGFVGTYSNPTLASDLRGLADELDDLAQAPAVERPPAGYRRPPRQILSALVEVLQAADEPMGPREVQLAAERLLGTPLRYGYVKQALSAHARWIEGAPLFDRAGGRYWMRVAQD